MNLYAYRFSRFDESSMCMTACELSFGYINYLVERGPNVEMQEKLNTK